MYVEKVCVPAGELVASRGSGPRQLVTANREGERYPEGLAGLDCGLYARAVRARGRGEVDLVHRALPERLLQALDRSQQRRLQAVVLGLGAEAKVSEEPRAALGVANRLARPASERADSHDENVESRACAPQAKTHRPHAP